MTLSVALMKNKRVTCNGEEGKGLGEEIVYIYVMGENDSFSIVVEYWSCRRENKRGNVLENITRKALGFKRRNATVSLL